ncbi:MAG: excinuclease ABC subunit UvrC [Acholeplasmataceae bacterium]|nr:excinuclease ABC subunit UvrC [Acholeplasmataceae bacterium]
MNEKLSRALAVLPDRPGVYLMRDDKGKIIYVGKAVVLKNRVRSYFRNLAAHTPKVKAMVAKIDDIETIVTDNELEALILECNLIKEHRPRYNISLKDDKSYPYLKVTVQEQYPRIYVTRRVIRDGAKYYGPYADAGALHATVKLVRELFPLRNCRKMNPDRPCLQYHIKRCLAPCAGYISSEDYGKMIKAVLMLVEGRTNEVVKDLKQRMKEAAEDYNFEEAARLRDQLHAVDRLNEQQKAVTSGGDQDAIALASDDTGTCLQIFFVRSGKLVGRDSYFLSAENKETKEEIITAFLKQYYLDATFVPREILLPVLPEKDELDLLTEWLTEKAKRKVELLKPQKGLKYELLKMVAENAEKNLAERLRKGQISLKSEEQAAEDLRLALSLLQTLDRIDCFDISHTQGSETVASMVVFRDGKPSKQDYRRYKIRSTEGKPDDFKSMQEVVYRRYRDIKDLPSLVIIDGGKGQLSSALEVIRGLGLHELPVIGLAKREEEIFVEGAHESILLSKDSDALKLIQRIRDEAHRFAITYHRKLRGKRNLVSILDHIEGIGPKRRQALWKHFGSLEAIKAAALEDLAGVEGMNKAIAQKIYDFFRMDLEAKRETIL